MKVRAVKLYLLINDLLIRRECTQIKKTMKHLVVKK